MRRRRRRWTRKKLVCLLAAPAAAAAASSDSISRSAKPSIFRTFLFLAHNSLADQNPTTIKNTDLHVTHLAHAHPHPISTVLSRAPAGCGDGDRGWGEGAGVGSCLRKETPGTPVHPRPHPLNTRRRPLPPTQTPTRHRPLALHNLAAAGRRPPPRPGPRASPRGRPSQGDWTRAGS